MASEPRRRPPQRRPPPRRRRRRRGGSDLVPRLLAAAPAIAFAVFITAEGGIVFAAGLFVVGALSLAELYRLTARVRPVALAGYMALLGLLLAAHYGDQFQMMLVLVASVPLTFLLTLMRPDRENAFWGMAATLLGIVWIGLALSHAVLLRQLDHGGALVVDVLIGTFVGDTCAYFGGRAWGQRPLAPRISPNKTVEGLIIGIVGGTLAFWGFEVAYQQFMRGSNALVIGFAVAIAAPLGDLFESLIKRDLNVKDTGRVFGAHGGALDRLDGVMFTIVAGYYIWISLVH
ncbi:MAG TPA: phosphatidate cytidylyltransferase [Thermoleophilaceae bacterium]|nr:phosphatidate cytidylyltransferase [Thermoleophilaceae bacterium]